MKWTNELIKEELIKSIEVLDLKRMPTGDELKSIGRNDLHCKISRTKKYSGWSEELGLPLKSSNTVVGFNNEIKCKVILEKMDYKVELTSTKFPYDLLVNDCVKIDVKTSRKHYYNHIFGINKTLPTCDLYICLAFDYNREIEKTFIIPSHLIKVKSLNISDDSSYNRFIDAWHYIEQYSDFFKSIN